MQLFEFNHPPYQFSYTLLLMRRKTVVFKIMPDSSLLVKAPSNTSQSWLQSLILKKLAWITSQQSIMQNKQHTLNKRFSAGSMCYYLGNPYILDLHAANSPHISLEADRMIVHCPDSTQTAGVLRNWYRTQAEHLFTERLQVCYQAMQHLAVPFPKTLRIKLLKSRWGSCSASQNVSLNIELIQYPLTCIDYVIFHELCHLRELNHGPGFYTLLSQAMAGWQTERQRLRHLHRTMPGIG